MWKIINRPSVSWEIVGVFEIVVLLMLFLSKETFSRRKIMFFEVVLLLLNESIDIFILFFFTLITFSVVSLSFCPAEKTHPQLSEIHQLCKVKCLAVPILTCLAVSQSQEWNIMVGRNLPFHHLWLVLSCKQNLTAVWSLYVL